MRRRIARKILKRRLLVAQRYAWGDFVYYMPVHYGLYHKACETLKQRPYNDKKSWLYSMNLVKEGKVLCRKV